MSKLKILSQFPSTNATTPSLVIVVAEIYDDLSIGDTDLYRISISHRESDYITIEKLQTSTGEFMHYADSTQNTNKFGEEVAAAIVSTITDKIGKDKFVDTGELLISNEWENFIEDLIG